MLSALKLVQCPVEASETAKLEQSKSINIITFRLYSGLSKGFALHELLVLSERNAA